MDETQGKVRHLSLTLTRVAGVALAIFFILIAIGAAPALVVGAALAGAALLVLAHAPGFGVWHIESKAIMQSLARAPGVLAPRTPQEAEKKAFEPLLTSPPPRLTPAI